MADYLHTVDDIRKALKGLKGDMPVSFYVDTDALERQSQGMPVLVKVTIAVPTLSERKEREELSAEGIKDQWAHRETSLPKSYVLFLVG